MIEDGYIKVKVIREDGQRYEVRTTHSASMNGEHMGSFLIFKTHVRIDIEWEENKAYNGFEALYLANKYKLDVCYSTSGWVSYKDVNFNMALSYINNPTCWSLRKPKQTQRQILEELLNEYADVKMPDSFYTRLESQGLLKEDNNE